MPKTKISEFSATAGNNTDIDGINIAEGCPPSGINDAIRELMAQLKDFQAGTAGDSFNGPVGTTTPAAGAFTNLSASGTFALTGDQVQISEGGTGQTTANAAFNALAPSQSTHAGKYLKTDGTNTSWDAIEINTADITGTLPIANGGTGLTALGTGVQTALGIAVGSSGAFVVNGGALGTPSSGTVTNLTGTASININGTVGATTPTTGAFTTLSASGNITVSGGTANGVAYLNGSKVLTTGSALSFDGTNLGVGTASPGFRLDAVNNAAGLARFSFSNPNAGMTQTDLRIGAGSNTNDIFVGIQSGNSFIDDRSTNGALLFSRSGTEQMRLTSTGLGIGTSSPGTKLDVVGGTRITSSSSGALTFNAGTDTVNTKFGILFNTPTYSGGIAAIRAERVGASDAGQLLFYTAPNGDLPNLRATLDSAGNLGLGVTPSAWNSTKAMQLGLSGSVFGDGQALNWAAGLGMNCYGVASGASRIWRRVSSEPAYLYQMANGGGSAVNGHAWYIAGSGGAAGDTISFTQAMTLDASGNLLAGLTSPLYGTTNRVQINANGPSTAIISVSHGGLASQSGYMFWDGTNLQVANNSTSGALIFGTNAATERARITSGGEFLVGTTSASYALSGRGVIEVNGSSQSLYGFRTGGTPRGYLLHEGTNLIVSNDTSTGYISFQTQGAERARITSGGYFKASNTGSYLVANSYHELRSDNNTYIAYTTNTNASPFGVVIEYSNAAPNGGGNRFLYCGDTGAERASIRSNGGLANYSANDVNLSDRREKTNFAPAKSYLDTICAIPVQTFNYIDQSEDDPGLTLGVVAQDVQAVAPELVMESNWGTEDSPKMRLSIYQTDLQYALMKCIQELKAQNDDLRARVAQLEAK